MYTWLIPNPENWPLLPFIRKYDVSIAVAFLLLIGLVITWITVGPNEALRAFVAEAVILAATFYIARQYLPWEDAGKERVKKPKLELALAIAAYIMLLVWASEYFTGGSRIPALALSLLLPIAVLAIGRYGRMSWGLRWPAGRELLVLFVIVVINIALGQLFGRVLPESELPVPEGADLAAGGAAGMFTALVSVLFVAAIPEELFFRVFLQPRLAHFIPGRWALFLQAVLFSLAHFPQHYLGWGYPLPYAGAQVLILSNGIMAGYFWRKTGNLPLLILLHLFFFPRFGL